MPHVTGRDLLPRIVQEHPEVPVIVVTANAELDTAVQCMREGAFDYLLKPVEDARLVSAVRHAVEMRQARRESRQPGTPGNPATPVRQMWSISDPRREESRQNPARMAGCRAGSQVQGHDRRRLIGRPSELLPYVATS